MTTSRRRADLPTARRPQGRVRVGVSGWQYDSWRGDFYPEGLARNAQLAHLGRHLPTVELNGSFYSLQRPTSYRRWGDSTPADFVFAVKGGRYITHLKGLRDVETPLANFFASGVLGLAEKLGPFLWQLPERMAFDPGLTDDFLSLLPHTAGDAATVAAGHDDKVRTPDYAAPLPSLPLRHALEVRNPSFDAPAFFDLLGRHGVACVVADGASRWPLLDEPTTDFDYIRLHGHTRLYTSRYADATLDRWATRCRTGAEAGRDVYVYFDNDARGHAPWDALRLSERLGTPGGSDV